VSDSDDHPAVRSVPTIWSAATRLTFPLSWWPWRALGYLASTVPVAATATLLLTPVLLPWAVLLRQTTTDPHWPSLRLTMALLVGTALVAAGTPLFAVPLGVLERWRLALVDDRPVRSGHRRPDRLGPAAWLRARYTEAATWRAFAYTGLLLAVLMPVYVFAALAVLLVGVLIASPMLVGDGPVTLGWVQVHTSSQAIWYLLLGLVLLPAVPYLLAAVAGGHAVLARSLLHSTSDGEQLRDELVEVARSRVRMADAFQTERRRIERDLHDVAQQRLVGLTLALGMAKLDLPADSPAGRAVDTAHSQAKELLTELRDLVHNIHPQLLTDQGLAAALQQLADRCPVPVRPQVDLPGRLPAQVEATLYFAIAEAVANIARHSGAADADIRIARAGALVLVEISDDGRGGADPAGGTGLTGIADRLAVIGGRMLLSSPPGGPTTLRMEVPCQPTR
jgi:signal transduction histidine kinase